MKEPKLGPIVVGSLLIDFQIQYLEPIYEKFTLIGDLDLQKATKTDLFWIWTVLHGIILEIRL